MQQAAVTQPSPARLAGLSRLAWLSSPTLLLCLVGVVLPNALSVGALLAGIGSPPRTTAIIVYATLAVMSRLVPPPVTILLFLAAVAYDAISTLALLFNLAPSEIGLALRLSTELNLFASPLYVVLICALAALLAVNIAILTLKRRALQKGSAVLMMGMALLLAAGDLFANTSPHYHYGTLYGQNVPMESASASSGFAPSALTRDKPHVLMVMVEALGQFADPEHQAVLLRPFQNSELAKRYDVSTGTTTYYGSTTAAEMRELCNTRESYHAAIEGKKLDCMPARMAAKGYRTVSLHNFTSAFFQRNDWYPRLGFQKQLFREDLDGFLKRQCGGPFKGPCDTDIVPFVAQKLREAKKPTFLYWLTLSTHVPIAPDEGSPRLGCEDDGGPLGHAEVCDMTEMWMDVFDAIVRMTADIPPTEILLVGDHAPPLWSKAGRELFEPGKTTWIRLTPKRNAAEAHAHRND